MRFPDSTVTRSGRKVTFDELPALEFAARYSFPVPRVYRAESWPKRREVSIRMGFVNGEELQVILTWNGYRRKEKHVPADSRHFDDSATYTLEKSAC